MPDVDRLEEIRAREQAATKGPWIADGAEIHQGEGDIPAFWGTWIGETLNIDDDPASNANAKFVAHARADIPWLISEVVRLRAEVQQLAAENHTLEQGLGLNEAA